MMQLVAKNITSCHLSFSCWHLVARLLQEMSDIFEKMSHILQEKSDIFGKMSHVLTKKSHVSENMPDISSETSIEKVGYSQINYCMAILL